VQMSVHWSLCGLGFALIATLLAIWLKNSMPLTQPSFARSHESSSAKKGEPRHS